MIQIALLADLFGWYIRQNGALQTVINHSHVHIDDLVLDVVVVDHSDVFVVVKTDRKQK